MNSSEITDRENQTERDQRNAKIRISQEIIRADLLANGNLEDPRTKENNAIYPAKTVEEDIKLRQDVVGGQINAWKDILPDVFKKFDKVKDPRRPKSIKHKLAVLLMHALLLFVFKFGARKAIHKELAKPYFHENMKELFPEFDSSPHSSTVARALERIDPVNIEAIHIDMIKKLIKSKKFIRFLIQGNTPVSIDGVQKMVRDGDYQGIEWLERKVKSKSGKETQQYVAILEANITLHNGLTLPLLSEFLYYDGNEDQSKQDCELTGFKRISEKLKSYFKRQNIILLMDKLYATANVLMLIKKFGWKYIIVLPSNRLTVIDGQLAGNKDDWVHIPNQIKYRGREQRWYWENDIEWKGFKDLNAVSCFEKWYETNKKTGEEEAQYSEHKWISNITFSIKNLHELCNLGARKRWGIEDSNNTEKNRGYHYKHAYSYNWNGMKCFHLMMRLAHAINALSEYTKVLKKYIRDHGCGYTLALIKETLWAPILGKVWLNQQMKKRSILTIN
jgi:hypothetical protein